MPARNAHRMFILNFSRFPFLCSFSQLLAVRFCSVLNLPYAPILCPAVDRWDFEALASVGGLDDPPLPMDSLLALVLVRGGPHRRTRGCCLCRTSRRCTSSACPRSPVAWPGAPCGNGAQTLSKGRRTKSATPQHAQTHTIADRSIWTGFSISTAIRPEGWTTAAPNGVKKNGVKSRKAHLLTF